MAQLSSLFGKYCKTKEIAIIKLCYSAQLTKFTKIWLLPIYELLFYVVLKLSCDETPLRSLHSFESGQSLNTYPPHYKTTFAFSEIPYPLTYRLPLRFGYHSHGDNWAYHVPYIYLTSDLGSTFRCNICVEKQRSSQA